MDALKPQNPERLRELVDGYMSARMYVNLNQRGTQPSAFTELDAAVRLQELRDYWQAMPGVIWYDWEDSELVWNLEKLIAICDERADEAADELARRRADMMRGDNEPR